jgi:hypothetical protein
MRSFIICAVRQVQLEQVKENEMSRECGTNGAKRNAYRILVGKLEGKRPLGKKHDVGGKTILKWILDS